MSIHATLCCLARVGERISFWIVILLIVFSPAIYWGVLNALGPSSYYSEPWVEVGGERRDEVYVGEVWQVIYRVRRRSINGNCFIPIYRYAEYVGGPKDGQRLLVDYAEIRFAGTDDVFYPRWPRIARPVTSGRNAAGEVVPLLPAGVDEQVVDLYVVARYYCNPLDSLLNWLEDHGIGKGRYIQGGAVPDRTAHVRVTFRRKPT